MNCTEQPFVCRWLDTPSGSHVAAKVMTGSLFSDFIDVEVQTLKHIKKKKIPRVLQLVEVLTPAPNNKYKGRYIISECVYLIVAVAAAAAAAAYTTHITPAHLFCHFCRFVQGISLSDYIAWRRSRAFTAGIEENMLTTAAQLVEVRFLLSAR